MTDQHLPTPAPDSKRHGLWGGLVAAVSTLLAACGIRMPHSASSLSPDSASRKTSDAPDPKAYRKDAAQHLYALNAQRIYQGQLPPLLYAIGTLQVNVGRQGEVRSFNWMRAPRHAPEVIKEIERTVRAAAPFPIAPQLGYVTYTDTWLWHQSGHFQLDTLTEGQRDSSSEALDPHEIN